MKAVPCDIPLTVPEDEPTDAKREVVLHTPVPVASLKVICELAHTLSGAGVIAAGSGLTVITVLIVQPVGNV